MESKKMYLANFNLTFGAKDEPLLKWIDDFVLPALRSGIKRKLSTKAEVMFKDVEIQEVFDGELILKGLILKDTTIDIYNQYDEEEGLLEKEEHHKSAPYSVFMIYLKNHRMVLVKRQSGSPDLRLFTSTVMDILKEYRKIENARRRESGECLLPFAIIGIKGIKDERDISQALKDVKKIKKLTMKILPRNNELKSWDGLLDCLDDQIRRESNSRTMKIVINSPQSKVGVEKIIKETNGLVCCIVDI